MSRYKHYKFSKAFLRRISHPADLVPEHPLYFIAHGFSAGGAEMDCHSVGGFPDFLHKRGAFILLHRQRNRPINVADVSRLFFAHCLCSAGGE